MTRGRDDRMAARQGRISARHPRQLRVLQSHHMTLGEATPLGFRGRHRGDGRTTPAPCAQFAHNRVLAAFSGELRGCR
jgi:hypothetical protein